MALLEVRTRLLHRSSPTTPPSLVFKNRITNCVERQALASLCNWGDGLKWAQLRPPLGVKDMSRLCSKEVFPGRVPRETWACGVGAPGRRNRVDVFVTHVPWSRGALGGPAMFPTPTLSGLPRYRESGRRVSRFELVDSLSRPLDGLLRLVRVRRGWEVGFGEGLGLSGLRLCPLRIRQPHHAPLFVRSQLVK